MKLLFCLDCYDIVKLLDTERTCCCGKSKGMYIDNINAEYSGNAKLLGIANNSFRTALLTQSLKDNEPQELGTEFIAFVIPKSANSINKKD